MRRRSEGRAPLSGVARGDRRLDGVPRLLGHSLAALTLVAALGLAGCTGGTPDPAPATPDASATEAGADAADTASPGGTDPVAPSATATAGGEAPQLLPLFSETVGAVWSGPEKVSGRAYIDALTAAGFDKSAMQVTADQSTIGNAAESIEFAVRIGDQCLVGQVGPSIGDPVTTVLPGLSSGGCLIGSTRPINW